MARSALLCALLLVCVAALAADTQEAKKAGAGLKTSTTPMHKTKPTTRKPANATATTASATRQKPTTLPPATLASAGTAAASAATATSTSATSATGATTLGTTLPAVGVTEPPPPTTIMDSTASTAAATRDGSGVGYSPARRETPIPPAAPAGGPQTPGTLSLPGGESATGVLTKPTKYHYYPHNQHIYLLPECAVQQVCNAVYVRLNYTQPLCACPSRHQDPCSASLNSDDLHTTELASTTRGKGPIIHDQPTYASVPGIRVYGMVCVKRPSSTANRKGRPLRWARSSRHPRSAKAYDDLPPFPWDRVWELARAMNLIKG